MRPEEELLEVYRESHPTVSAQLVDLKGEYISPKERKLFTMFYGETCVNQVFGEPTHLDKAEMLLFEIHEGKIDEASKCQKLIDIAKEIVEFCSEKQIFNYSDLLTTGISIILFEKSEVLQIQFLQLKSYRTSITIEELEKMREWANSSEAEKKLNANRKATLNYILETVNVSLELIIKDIRKEV